MIEYFIGCAYLLAWRIIRVLPEKFAYRLFNSLAERISRKKGRSFLRLSKNLSRVLPALTPKELEQLTRAGMKSYLRYWCDTFRLPVWSKERIISTVTLTGEKEFLAAVNSGKGVIVSLPHSGNWDHAGAYFCAIGIPIISVAERLKPDLLFRAFLRYRKKLGMSIYGTTENVIPTLLQHLNRGQVVALVADRDLSNSGVEVKFFGSIAKMPSGPALLALRSGAHLIIADIFYTFQGIHIKFTELPIGKNYAGESVIKNLTQQSANLFALGIAGHPEDWHMLQQIWIEK